ncbi:MAG: neutral/alkaline non-lysosomal ceramidase N-terminal domain-containing protein [Cytophagales bacterium]
MFNKYSAVIVSIVVLAIITIKPLDRTPLESTSYYKNTLKKFNYDSPNDISGDTIKVGWAKKSLIPNYHTPMAGYGARKGADFEGVHDSIWVRAVVFDNGKTLSAYVSMDLLIVPPNLEQSKISDNLGINSDNIFFTASHTHSSIGGYLEGLAGNIFGGKYDQRNLDFITSRTREAIRDAMQDLKKSKLGYGSIYAADFITNRLVGDSLGTYDPFLRIIKIVRDDGKKASIFSYSAHATCFGHRQRNLSGDYPSSIINLLEKNNDVDFAVYGAGSVGSMSPRTRSKKGEKKVQEMSRGLYPYIKDAIRNMGARYQTKLYSEKIDIEMREQSFKINSSLIIRPWIFNFLVGDTPKYINYLRLGDLVIVGTPSDFSGELVGQIEKSISNNELNLMINSFNGGYVGYITDDKWYDRTDINTYETYTMNWYGPYNGTYFSKLIKEIIKKNEKY